MLLVARVRALQDFLATDDGANLLAGYKRATNILTQEEKKDGVEYSLDPDPRFAETDGRARPLRRPRRRRGRARPGARRPRTSPAR